jgi:multiple sugar transport system substrate-binding protein
VIRPLAILLSCLALASCGVQQPPDEIVVQRFFGTCNAQYGNRTDVAAAEGECGIMTTLINKFSAENPDVRVRVSPVAWPGYNQLAAQLAAGDPPDLVTMHLSSIPDYQSRALIEPIGKDLRAVGVDPQGFTAASSAGVNMQGDIYGLPIDNWAPLWHVNMNYFRQAGLVKDGKPILPRSPEELLDHARRFKAATGKPYLVQTLAIERASYARNLYTLLMQQNANFFPDPQRIQLQSPEAKRVLDLFRQIYIEDLTTKNLDYAASTNAFINGAGGVFIVGTWLIGDFEAESRRPDRPLSNGYTVRPFPQLFAGRDATYIDGHAWVMPTKERTPQQREAVFRLLKFFADNNFEWSRTGHLPAYRAVIESERFNALPHRREIAKLSAIGMPLPAGVQRQFPVADIIGEEMSAAITGHKPIDAALADAEHRVNDLLFHLL